MKEEEQRLIFNSWIGQYRALIFKVLKAYAQTSDDQDDLFQDISLQVWRSIPNFKQKSAVSTWIYRISINTALSWSTKEKKKGNQHSIEQVEHLIEPIHQEEDERLVWLYDEIRKLDEVDRSLTLLLLDGFSYKDMAQMVGISESNIGVKIHRIKKHLIKESEKIQQHGI